MNTEFLKISRNFTVNKLTKGILCAFMLSGMLAANGTALSAPSPASNKVAYSAIKLNYQGKTLRSVVDEIKGLSGIEFKLPTEMSDDLVNRAANANTWADAVKAVLNGYSYLGESGDNGKLKLVIITGRNDNNVTNLPSTAVNSPIAAHQSSDLLSYQPNPKTLPAKYRGLNAGSVSLVTIPFEQLSKVNIGETVSLRLPTGQYDVVHDNAFAHKNGDQTWVGYLDQEGKEFRVVITSGQNGGIGQIITPDGEYQIEQENGVNYLVNMKESGLAHGSLENDQAMESPYSYNNIGGMTLGHSVAGITNEPIAAAGLKDSAAAAQPSNTTANTTVMAATTVADTCDVTGPIMVNGVDQCSTVVPSVIDIMFVYTPGMNTAGLDTRLNQLIAVTNQAFIDSKIVMSYRLVGKLLASYSETYPNETALTNMTMGTGAFSKVSAFRSQVGADLVVLIRPFYYAGQGSCGYAWVNGSNGTSLAAKKGFATVSDGFDRAGSAYYCNDYTFAHETGHSLGNVHERGSNAPTPGAYPFSYGWGVSGTVGTIMSYLRPLVPYFANPNIICSGLACGVPTTAANSADNAATTNLTGNKVANFMPTKIAP